MPKSLLFTHPDCQPIALALSNEALSLGTFPESWNETCVSLLPKKSDLPDLKNWRPISLINTYAKVSIRSTNARVIRCASSIVNPYQTGFVRGRFIDDNGLLMKQIMDHASQSRSNAI